MANGRHIATAIHAILQATTSNAASVIVIPAMNTAILSPIVFPFEVIAQKLKTRKMPHFKRTILFYDGIYDGIFYIIVITN